jgi:putative transposase
VRRKGLKPGIYSGKPTQNDYIERFNRLYQEAVLDAYLFFDLQQVRQLTAEWIEECNQRRPHEGLGNLTPFEWKESLVKKEIHHQMTV